VSGCARGYASDMCAHHFLGFPLYRPALFGISTLPPSTFWDFHFTARYTEKDAFQHYNRHRQPTFRYRRDKKIFYRPALT